MSIQAPGRSITIATEVWIITALLHLEQPDRESFSLTEIQVRLARENITGRIRPGIPPHLYQHCVATKAPNTEKHRMLTPVRGINRRLFRPGDSFHPYRAEGRTHPPLIDIPERYRHLLTWYLNEYVKGHDAGEDPILALSGLGRAIWADEDADSYVNRLRAGW